MWNRVTKKTIASFEDFIGIYKLCKSRGTDDQCLEGNRQAYAALRAVEEGDEKLFKQAWHDLRRFSRSTLRPHTDRMFYDHASFTRRSWTDLVLCNLTAEAASLANKWVDEDALDPPSVERDQGFECQEVVALYQWFTDLRDQFGAKLYEGDLFAKCCVERDQSPECQQFANLYVQFTKLWINDDVFGNSSAPRHQHTECQRTVALFQQLADLNKQFNALWINNDPSDTSSVKKHQDSEFQQFLALHKQFADWRARHSKILLDNLQRSLTTRSTTHDVTASKNVNAVRWL